MSRTVEEWVALLRKDLVGCGADGCVPQWDPEDERLIWTDGERCTLDSLMDSHRAPDRLRREIADRMRCPRCGEELGLGSVAARRSDAHRHSDAMREEWKNVYVPLLVGFEQHLERYPYLAALHPLAKRFIDELESFPEAANIEKRAWHRARPPEDQSVLASEEMMANPDPESEGRFTHYGQAALYVGSDADVAAAECLRGKAGIVWLQEFELSKVGRVVELERGGHPEDLAELPITAAGMNWTSRHRRVPGTAQWKPEYFVPRFIADCARRAGYEGILYSSARFCGECLVIFNPSRIGLRAVGSPEIVKWDPDEAERRQPF